MAFVRNENYEGKWESNHLRIRGILSCDNSCNGVIFFNSLEINHQENTVKHCLQLMNLRLHR